MLSRSTGPRENSNGYVAVATTCDCGLYGYGSDSKRFVNFHVNFGPKVMGSTVMSNTTSKSGSTALRCDEAEEYLLAVKTNMTDLAKDLETLVLQKYKTPAERHFIFKRLGEISLREAYQWGLRNGA